MTANRGKIHSIESMGTLDGPGVRTVVFMQGCPLRCQFCHNIDCALPGGGKLYTPHELLHEVLKNRPYWGRMDSGQIEVSGGVTLSGGDPLFQPLFVAEFVKLLKNERVHVTLDTAMFGFWEHIRSMINDVDLWMISIKHMDPVKHEKITGVPSQRILSNITQLDHALSLVKRSMKPRIRIRFLVVPSLTDDVEHLHKLAEFVGQLKNFETVELLSYGSHGAFKWRELFGSYALEGTREATARDLKNADDILTGHGLTVLR